MDALKRDYKLSISHWNIEGFKQGSHSKFNDQDFRTELSRHDIIGLTETHAGPDDNLALTGYTSFSYNRKKHKKARKHSGGITVLIKNELVDGIEIISISSDLIWVRLKETFFNFAHDLYIGYVYISPQNSLSTRDLSEKTWKDLEADSLQYMNRGKYYGWVTSMLARAVAQ